jgi:hypothetical protein
LSISASVISHNTAVNDGLLPEEKMSVEGM